GRVQARRDGGGIMRGLALVACLLLAACAWKGLGTVVVTSQTKYPPVKGENVAVLAAPPEGAEKLGTVNGLHIFRRDPVEDARTLAGEIGADAIVVTARGTTFCDSDPFNSRPECVWA